MATPRFVAIASARTPEHLRLPSSESDTALAEANALRDGPMNPLPARYAREYLERAPSLVWLVAANVAFTVVGVRFYVDRGLAGVSTFLWPLFMDSPAATALAALSFATLLPNLGRRLEDAPANRPLAYLHTLAFVWLVKYGLWTAVALNVGFRAYFPDPFAYFGVIVTHLFFAGQALLIPYYGHTTRGALGLALGLALLNDLLDYGFLLSEFLDHGLLAGLGAAYHPPLRYEPGAGLAVATVLLSVLATLSAVYLFPRYGTKTAHKR